jgi:hypothetical protein
MCVVMHEWLCIVCVYIYVYTYIHTYIHTYIQMVLLTEDMTKGFLDNLKTNMGFTD